MRGRQHYILLGILVAFTMVIIDGTDSTMGKVWWLGGCGLFLIWQPVVNTERRLSWVQAGLLFGAVAALVLRLDWPWLAVSLVFLASLLSGMLLVVRDRRLGWYYLLAFAYLCLLLFFWVSPRLYGSVLTADEAAWARWLIVAALLATTVSMPWRRLDEDLRVFDFVASLLILLILISVLMAVGVQVAISRLTHLEATVRALIGLGGAVLLLSWVWNPRLGFGGFGPMFYRYVFRFGFPFEEWLRRLSDLFDREEDPELFLEKALESFLALPWVSGGRAERPGGLPAMDFGGREKHTALLSCGELSVTLYTTHAWPPSLAWQANLLLRLVEGFYRARQRERLLRQLQYVEAVYETGSRVTHDVKNLLQSIEGLCFAVRGGETDLREGGDAPALDLARRQLPEIARRLRATLDRLAAPAADDEQPTPLADWWSATRLRHRTQDVRFGEAPAGRPGAVPAGVFDNVLDNLLANALQKRVLTPTLNISVTLFIAGDTVTLTVGDDGPAVDPSRVKDLFVRPLPSPSGFGVGLYHAARLAERLGYRLELANNQSGDVRFSLNGPLVGPRVGPATR